jgi:hypothetical protein
VSPGCAFADMAAIMPWMWQSDITADIQAEETR